MASQYLAKTLSALVKDDGSATVTFSPPVGQYWAVAAMRVSSTTQPQFNFGKAYPYCAVFAGPTGVVDASTFMDDTTLGSGDTTSVISGTITSYGESLTASWQFARAGDNAIMTIYGRVYDNLVELQQQLAPVPGARFAGTTANASVWFHQTFHIDTAGHNFINDPPIFDTPSNSFTEIVSFKYVFSTSAVVANRSMGVQFLFPPNLDVIRTFAPAVQGAGGNVTYSFAEGVSAVNNGQNQGSSLPSRLICPPSSRIQGFGTLVGVADTWANLMVAYRQYTSFTNVSFS